MVLETYTGLYFDYDDPQPEQISLSDIARALSYTARFGGHTKRFYSVAEHALLVRALVSEVVPNRLDLQLAALHHDSHEAYLGDVPTPLSRTLEDEGIDIIATLKHRIDTTVAAFIGIDPDRFHDPIVRQADKDALVIEAEFLKKSQGRGLHWQRNRDAAPLARMPRFWRPNYTPSGIEIDFKRVHHELLRNAVPA